MVIRIYNHDEHVFESEDQANITLAYMKDILDTYGFVTAADYLELLGEDSSYVDDKYGWTNLDDAKIYRQGVFSEDQTGESCVYALVLPDLEELHKKGDEVMEENKVVVKESFGTKLGRFVGQVGSAVFLLSLVACFAAACISLTAKFIIWLF